MEAADTPEVKSQKFDENLEWTMLDKDYDDRTRRTFTGPVFMPMLVGTLRPDLFNRAASHIHLGQVIDLRRAEAHSPCPAQTLPPRWWAACRPSPTR